MRDFYVQPASVCCRVPQFDPRNAVVIILMGMIVGCGGEEWHAKAYPASGHITINAAPPEGAVVTLHPIGEQIDKRGSNPWGIVQSDGSFRLSTYESGDGAPAGDYAVNIRWPLDVTDMSAAMTDRLGGAYLTADRSQWRVTIREEENELPPIVLAGVDVQSEQDIQPPQQAFPGPNMN